MSNEFQLPPSSRSGAPPAYVPPLGPPPPRTSAHPPQSQSPRQPAPPPGGPGAPPYSLPLAAPPATSASSAAYFSSTSASSAAALPPMGPPPGSMPPPLGTGAGEGNNTAGEALRAKILEYCKGQPRTTKDLSNYLLRESGFTDIQVIAHELNRLAKETKQLKMVEHHANGRMFVTTGTYEEEDPKFKGLDPDERTTLSCIAQAIDKGIWIGDLRHKTGLSQVKIAKCIKGLESRKLIKPVKCLNSKTKKVYMLAEIEPSEEVTGGAWYTENAELDEGMVTTMYQQVIAYLGTKNLAKADEFLHYIKETGIFTVALRVEDVEKFLLTLVADGVIDEIYDQGWFLYRLKTTHPTHNALGSTPCAHCPVASQCSSSMASPVNPRSCVYLTKWSQDMETFS
ncbi:DNA-directed RNA polymerase III subunit RPC6 [Pelomyxa schiedti]|nr:DNA-directed RNA polymerase III subunit RPC6 [Pelomyxa schiedti]